MRKFEVSNDGGHISVTTSGTGPLILCIPGMGETQRSFRHLTPHLIAAGFQVAIMDLRGHGESSTNFATYDDVASANDAIRTIELLTGKPATIVGNSMGAAVAVIAAVKRPDLVSRVVLIGPFVRDHGSAASRMLMRVALSRPWGPHIWANYYASLFGQVRESDHAEHVLHTLSLLRRPGRWRSFTSTTRTSHAPAESILPQISVPSLVVMGTDDRDFSDPEQEAAWVANATNGTYRMIDGAGHYPMAERPKATFEAMLPFLSASAPQLSMHQEDSHG